MQVKINRPTCCNVFIVLIVMVFVAGFNSFGQKFTDKWQQYRGPEGDGVSTSTYRIKPWPADGQPHLVWKQPIGEGFSGISVSGNQLIVAFGEGDSEFIAGYDRMSGKEGWRCSIGKLFKEEFGDGPRATPLIDGNHAYIYNSWGHLYCVDIRTGTLKWKAELSDHFKIKMMVPRRGFSSSPIVIGNKVIIYTGGNDNTAFMALQKNTGKVLWRTGSTSGSYSSPVAPVINGITQLIFATSRAVEIDGKKKGVHEVVSLNSNGKELWRGPGLPGVVAMPVFIPPNKIFVSSSLEIGSKLIRVNVEGKNYKAEEVWNSPNMRNHFNSSVYFEGHIYGFSNATLECLDAETAERKWRKRGMGKGSLIIVNGKLIVLSDKGKLIIAKATAEGYRELAGAKVIKGKSWTSPTFADGYLYLRNLKEMACYDLTK
jgi:outer membrane protein assembly factor BamB